ncbi:MAG: hypothetical protein GXP22_00800 [Gammaproteobacteria bacterium]|nr:hypothetical protein [Gammaproteobacteria bacterium]
MPNWNVLVLILKPWQGAQHRIVKWVYIKVSKKIARRWKLTGSYDYYSNNLDGRNASGTTKNQLGSFGLKRTRLFDRKSLVVSTSLRQKRTRNNTYRASMLLNRGKAHRFNFLLEKNLSDTYASGGNDSLRLLRWLVWKMVN